MHRCYLRIPDVLKNNFAVDSNHASKMEELIAHVNKSNTTQIVRALKSQTAVATEASAPGASGNPRRGTGTTRTTCQPHFTDDDKPLDTTRVVDLASIPESDFQSTHESLSSRYLQNGAVQVGL